MAIALSKPQDFVSFFDIKERILRNKKDFFVRYCQILPNLFPIYRFPWRSIHKERKTQSHTSLYATESLLHMSLYYFLKKSGILMDCSFTLLVGVLGVSNDGAVPPTGLLGAAVVSLPVLDPVPKSSLGEPCVAVP